LQAVSCCRDQAAKILQHDVGLDFGRFQVFPRRLSGQDEDCRRARALPAGDVGVEESSA
jgi:hypothetical protein